jgi:hypothetical protein
MEKCSHINLHTIIEKISAEWIRYSEYEYREQDGREYLTPAADSFIMQYNPLDVAEDLVADALNLGALFCQSEIMTEKEKAALLGFVSKYGLLGFMMAIPLNGNFMEYPHVFFGRNAFFDVGYMETRDYLQYFQPFGIKEGQPKGVMDKITLLMGKDLEYSIMFSRNYAERTDWLFGVFSEFYTHFAACAAYHTTDNPALKDHCAGVASGFREYGLGFRMVMEDKPILVWDFNSLKMAMETVYGFMLSDAAEPLRICKKCGKESFASHGRLEFCSGRCRNQYNVYKHRGKGKAE